MDARDALLGRKARRTPFTFDGADGPVSVEIEFPSQIVREEFTKRFETEGNARAAAYLVVACTFKPGTADRVFKTEDVEAIVGLEADEAGPHTKIADIAATFIKDGIEAARKKSEPAAKSA